MTTVIIPMAPVPTPKCPECGRDEKIVRKCAHCGHVYEDPWTVRDVLFVGAVMVGGAALFVWVVLTALSWLFSWGHPSLMEVLRAQWAWLKAVRVW